MGHFFKEHDSKDLKIWLVCYTSDWLQFLYDKEALCSHIMPIKSHMYAKMNPQSQMRQLATKWWQYGHSYHYQ